MATATKRKPKRKAASAQPYFEAAGRILEGYGTNKAKPRPFNADAALKQFNHWAYAAANFNANAVANVSRRLFVRTQPGTKNYRTRPVDARWKRYLLGQMGESCRPSTRVIEKAVAFGGELQEVTDPHPAMQVLRTVNPWQNGYELDVLRMIDLQATGNSYLYVVDGSVGVPQELWRMPPQMTKVIPSKTLFIAGYNYGTPPDEERFSPSDVIHFKLPNPADMLYGKGWFEAAWTAIGLHDGKRTMDTAKMDNMARPDWLLSVKTPLRKEQLDNFEESVKKKLAGPKNAGKFFLVNGDIGATMLNQDVPEHGTPNRVIEEIAACSGVPVAMLLTNDPTKASSTSARVGWYRNTVRPYCRLDEEKLNEKYLPRFEGSEDMILAYDMVSFEDEEAQAKRLIGLVGGGINTPNEGRSELGYDRSDDPQADKLYPPSGSTAGAAAVAGDLAVNQNNDRQN